MGTITAKNRKNLSNHQKGVKTKPRHRRKKKRLSKAALLRKKISLLRYAIDVLTAIITDGFNTLPVYTYADYIRDIRTVRVRVEQEGLYFVTEILPQIAQDMFDYLEGRRSSHQRGVQGPLFKKTLRYAYDGKLEYVRFIYQVSVAFKKLKGSYSKDMLVSQYNDFIKTDEGLTDIDWFKEDRFDLLERVRAYARHFAKEVDPYGPDAIPRPGPGAVNTPVPPPMRYTPRVVYQQLACKYPYEEWFYHNPWEVNMQTREFLALKRELEPVSRFKFVPKTARKARGICIEENEVQFLQQGLRRVLTKAIQKHRLYKTRIVLHDQRVNGFMALWGSQTQGYATIDMSSASDRVARELVSWVFQDNQELHDCLMALSTKWISPPIEVGGDLLKTAKFAPMGSAICFPVMSLVFMFIARAAASLSKTRYPHLTSTNIFVYGDDIVVPSEIYQPVVEAFESLGLKINETKSFVRSSFRESCGVHAYKGVDITPIFVRKHPDSKSLSTLKSVIETEYQFHSRGWYCTAEILRRHAAIHFPKQCSRPFYVPIQSAVVGFKRTSIPEGNHLRLPNGIRWNGDYQCWERKALCFKSPVSYADVPTESQSFLRWIAIKPEPFESRKCPIPVTNESDSVVKLGWSWVPSSAVFC